MARERGQEQAKGKSDREKDEGGRERAHKRARVRGSMKVVRQSVSLHKSFHSYDSPTSSAVLSLWDPKPQLHKSDGATWQQ